MLNASVNSFVLFLVSDTYVGPSAYFHEQSFPTPKDRVPRAEKGVPPIVGRDRNLTWQVALSVRINETDRLLYARPPWLLFARVPPFYYISRGFHLTKLQKQVVKALVTASAPSELQAQTRLGQTPLYLAAYWVRVL